MCSWTIKLPAQIAFPGECWLNLWVSERGPYRGGIFIEAAAKNERAALRFIATIFAVAKKLDADQVLSYATRVGHLTKRWQGKPDIVVKLANLPPKPARKFRIKIEGEPLRPLARYSESPAGVQYGRRLIFLKTDGEHAVFYRTRLETLLSAVKAAMEEIERIGYEAWRDAHRPKTAKRAAGAEVGKDQSAPLAREGGN